MRKILILGAGKIGAVIAKLLSRSSDYEVRIGDVSAEALARLATSPCRLETLHIDVQDAAALRAAMRGCSVVVSALPYEMNAAIAQGGGRRRAKLFRSDRRCRRAADDSRHRGRLPAGTDFHAAVRAGARLRGHRGA